MDHSSRFHFSVCILSTISSTIAIRSAPICVCVCKSGTSGSAELIRDQNQRMELMELMELMNRFNLNEPCINADLEDKDA